MNIPTSIIKFVNFRRTWRIVSVWWKYESLKLLKAFLCIFAVSKVKQYRLCKKNNMAKWFNSMTVYMKRTSKAPDSCGGWAHVLWNVAEKALEHSPQISHMWDTWEVCLLQWELMEPLTRHINEGTNIDKIKRNLKECGYHFQEFSSYPFNWFLLCSSLDILFLHSFA